MTMAEVGALSKSHTQRALEGLRNHLAQNPGQMDLLVDKLRESGKKDEVHLISRFVKGRYPGVPYTVDAHSDGIANKNDDGMADDDGGSGGGSISGGVREVVSFLFGWVRFVVRVLIGGVVIGAGLYFGYPIVMAMLN